MATRSAAPFPIKTARWWSWTRDGNAERKGESVNYRMGLTVAAIGLLAPWAATSAAVNCSCVTADSCMVVCPGGDIPYTVFLYSDSECQVPVVGFDCIRLDFSEIEAGLIWCPEQDEDSTYPYAFPEYPSDHNGMVEFCLRLKGCSAGSQAYLQICGCSDIAVPCVKSLDIDGNGYVGQDDLYYCQNVLGTGECCCDFDCDGVVDDDDVALLLEHLLHGCGGATGCETALLSPADGAQCLGAEVELDWADVSSAQSYEVQVGSACGSGTTYVLDESQMTLSGLDAGSEYHWRARVMCSGTWGPWTLCRTFSKTADSLAIPSLVSPPDGEGDLPTSVTLSWDCVPEAVEYEVQVGEACGTGSVHSTASCFLDLSGLNEGTEYWWRVRSEGSCGGVSGWSACRRFSTAAPPPAPNKNGKWVLHYAGAHNSKTNTCSFDVVGCEEISVDAPGGPGRFDIYLLAVDVDEVAALRYGLYCEGDFYFYGWTSCTDLELPTDGWPGCGEGNAQTWSAPQAGPHVTAGILDVYAYGSAVSLSTGADPRVGFAEWCDGSQPSPLCHKTTNPGAFGKVGFGVAGFNPCSMVPAGLVGVRTKAVDGGIEIEWSPADAAGFREFYVHRSAGTKDVGYVRLGEGPVDGAGEGGYGYSYLDTEVIPGTLYYYKLEGVRRDGGSTFFGPYEVMSSVASAQYRLSQNVPNPLSRGGVTTIHYSLGQAGEVRIRILDAAGRLVRTMEERGSAGTNSVTWGGRDGAGRRVAGGVYFYEIRAKGFTAERKMVVVD